MNRISEKIEVKTPDQHFLYSKVQHLTDSLKMAKHMTQLDARHSAGTIEALCTEVDTLRTKLALLEKVIENGHPSL